MRSIQGSITFFRLYRFLIVGLALAFLVSILAGTAPAEAQKETLTTIRHTLRVNVNSYPDTLDPQLASFADEIGHIELLYEGLTRLDDALNPAPGAAQSWFFNAEGNQLTFTLRSGLTYSDGSILNAKRFEYAILRALDPVLQASYSGILYDIVGAAAYSGANPGTITPAELAALKAAVDAKALDNIGNPCTSYSQTDCLTLRLRFYAPAVYFLDIASLWIIAPVKEEIVTSGGSNWWQQAAFHIGNGPFVMTQLVPGNSAMFMPNPHYWRGQASYDINFSYITDSTTALQSYLNNQFDITVPNATDYQTINNDPTLKSQFVKYASGCTYALMFNAKPPFTDIKVREAFTRAIDRQGWVDQVLGGTGIPTLTWIPPSQPGYDPTDVRQSYNPTAALQALNDSSYGGAAGLPPIMATYSDSPRNTTRFQWLANQWNTILGVNVTLNPVDSATYTELTKNQATAPLFYILGWCADYPDPQNWLSYYWHSGGFSQRIYYSNPAVDALLDLADSTLDPVLRIDRYIQAQHLILEDTPAAFLWNSMNGYLIKPAIKGIKFTSHDLALPGSVDPLSIYIDVRDIFLPLIKR